MCENCGIKGHTKADCRKPGGGSYNKNQAANYVNQQSDSESEDDIPRAFMTNEIPNSTGALKNTNETEIKTEHDPEFDAKVDSMILEAFHMLIH